MRSNAIAHHLVLHLINSHNRAKTTVSLVPKNFVFGNGREYLKKNRNVTGKGTQL